MTRNMRFRNAMVTWFPDSLRLCSDADMQMTEQDFWNLFPDSFLQQRWLGFLIGQVERCPITGRLHLQLYLEFNPRVSLNKMQDCLPGLHIEPRRGSQKQAIDYVTKEDTRVYGPFEIGSPEPTYGIRIHRASGQI